MLDPEVKELAQGKNFAERTTLFGDGRPQTSTVWVDADDDHLLMTTEVHRAKFVNAERDSRVAVAIVAGENPDHDGGARGVVASTERGPAARAHTGALAPTSLGADCGAEVQSERVISGIEPSRQRSSVAS